MNKPLNYRELYGKLLSDAFEGTPKPAPYIKNLDQEKLKEAAPELLMELVKLRYRFWSLINIYQGRDANESLKTVDAVIIMASNGQLKY